MNITKISPDVPTGITTAAHLVAASVAAASVEIPSGKRIPFGWSDFAVTADAEPGTTILRWDPETLLPEGALRLRLGVSLDIRQTVRIEAREPQTGAVIGIFDFTQAPAFQIGEIPLSQAVAGRILEVGLELRRIQGSEVARFFGPAADVPVLLHPHIMAAAQTDPWAEFLKRMKDLDTIQPFSWMEGCLLEGVYSLDQAHPLDGYAKGLDRRVNLYLRERDLVYENPRSEPVDNTIYGIEGTLPFAVIARLRPDHASIQLAVDEWLKLVRPAGSFAAGSVQDYALTSAEGVICVGYPLAVIARQRGDAELEDLALAQFRIRKDLLIGGDGSIYLRNNNGTLTFRNWARGVTWYYLGLVRGIAELDDREDIDDLRAEAVRVMHYVLSRQLEGGLWANFIDDPDSEMDTSGSAGIAAALAFGYKHGILPVEARDAAVRARDGLAAYLTPDGLLAGGTPSNRSGEGAGNRRVIFPVGMGLAAQLLAALG